MASLSTAEARAFTLARRALGAANRRVWVREVSPGPGRYTPRVQVAVAVPLGGLDAERVLALAHSLTGAFPSGWWLYQVCSENPWPEMLTYDPARA